MIESQETQFFIKTPESWKIYSTSVIKLIFAQISFLVCSWFPFIFPDICVKCECFARCQCVLLTFLWCVSVKSLSGYRGGLCEGPQPAADAQWLCWRRCLHPWRRQSETGREQSQVIGVFTQVLHPSTILRCSTWFFFPIKLLYTCTPLCFRGKNIKILN